MVDFNNDTTIGTPAIDVVRILVLQRRSDLFEAIERYNKLDYQGTTPDIAIVRARLVSLFLEIQASLKRRLKQQEYDQLKEKIYSPDIVDIMDGVYYLNEYLDNMRLTRLDNRPHVDKTKWEEVNKAYGY